MHGSVPLWGIQSTSVGVRGAASVPGRKASQWGWPQVWVRNVCAWCPRTHPEDHTGRMEDILEELLQHREPEALQQCLRKVRAPGEGADWRDRPMNIF